MAAIKNPPVVYARQANIAQGHQQVNNGVTPHAHAGKNNNSQNELLSEENNATLDTRGTAKTSSVNQEMETVGTFNGSQDTRRQSQNAYKHGLGKLQKEMGELLSRHKKSIEAIS